MAEESQAPASTEAPQETTQPETKQESTKEVTSEPTKAEVQKAIEKMVAFKANGKDFNFNLGDEKQLEQLIRMAQKGDGAEVKMQKAAELEKAYEMFQKRLEEDFDGVLKERGIDPDEWAEKRIEAAIERAKKPPEQVAKEEEEARLKKELEELRKEAKERKEQEAKAKEEAELQKTQQDIIDQIDKALDAHKELPKTPNTRARIAAAMLQAQELGYKDIKIEEIIPIIKREMNQEYLNLLDNLPDDILDNWLGPKTVERVIKKKKLVQKEPPTVKVEDTGKVKKSEEEVPKKKIPFKEFFKKL